MPAKTDLRAILRGRRAALSAGPEGLVRSRRLQARLLKSGFWPACRRVVAYVSVNGEAGTADILAEAWRTEREVFLPRCRRKGEAGWPGTMDFFLCSGADHLEPSPFGIPEPGPAARTLSEEELARPDTLIIVPALAFDRAGFRLGYGGGYYDRLLARSSCPSVGLSYHDLLLDTLPHDSWDRPVKAVCTEETLLCL